MLAV
ncbi:copper/zinc superoxide dismutase family protein, partial [Vibrio parahaemolyticus V-223/04]|jgi:hypothetical protein